MAHKQKKSKIVNVPVVRSIHDANPTDGDFKDIFKLPIMYLKEVWRKGIL